jgi:hypothetical protein
MGYWHPGQSTSRSEWRNWIASDSATIQSCRCAGAHGCVAAPRSPGARQKRPSRARGQNATDAGRDLIHDNVRHMAGGIAAEQPEHARSAEVGVQVAMPRDSVKVGVLEALGFGEERDIGLVAADDLPQRGCQAGEQWPRSAASAGVSSSSAITCRAARSSRRAARPESVGLPARSS